MGKGISANTLPSRTTTKPPSISPSRFAAAAISSSEVPTTQILWLSWLTVDAIAPDFKPKPCTKPVAIFPFLPCRSTTAILTTSFSKSGSTPFGPTLRSNSRLSVMILPGIIPIARVLPLLECERKLDALTFGALTLLRPTGATALRAANKSSETTLPADRTISAWQPSRLSTTTISARCPGAIKPRSKRPKALAAETLAAR